MTKNAFLTYYGKITNDFQQFLSDCKNLEKTVEFKN